MDEVVKIVFTIGSMLKENQLSLAKIFCILALVLHFGKWSIKSSQPFSTHTHIHSCFNSHFLDLFGLAGSCLTTLILHLFNGLFLQDNLGKPAPER